MKALRFFVMALSLLAGQNDSSAASLGLVSGWNLVGNSVEAPLDVATSFGDSSKVVTVWKWETTGTNAAITYPAWAFYTPSLADGGASFAASKGYDFLTTINPGEGFWVNASATFSVNMPSGALVPTSSFQSQTSGTNKLPTGWSLVSVGDNPTPQAFDIGIGASTPPAGTIPDNIISLWAWDNASSNWYFYSPSLDSSGTLSSFISSKKYLDFGSKVLDPTIGFWVNQSPTSVCLTDQTWNGSMCASTWWPPATIAPVGTKVSGANQLPAGCNTWTDVCWQNAVKNGTVKFVATSAVMTGYSNRPIVFAYFRNTTTALGVTGLWNVLPFYADDGSPVGPDISGGATYQIDFVVGTAKGEISHDTSTGLCYETHWNQAQKLWETGSPVSCP